MKTKRKIVPLAGGGSYLTPNIVRGGQAIDLGNNFYYMKGRKHKNGGIDIGENPRTGLEVEGGEVVEVRPDDVRVYSSVPFLRGNSPAELVINGNNPNAVFNAQEHFKNVNRINDDGSKYKCGGRKKAQIGTEKQDNTYAVKPVIQDFIPATEEELKKREILEYVNRRQKMSGAIDIVSPEFDILTGIRSLSNIPKNFFNTKDVKDVVDNYYRQGRNIVDDAKRTGFVNVNSDAAKGKTLVINGKTINFKKTFDVPFWSKDKKWYGDGNLDVIVSKGDNGFDWIPINQHGRKTTFEKAASRRTPLTDGNIGNTPIKDLLFYKKYPIIGYGNVTNGEFVPPITGLNTLYNNITNEKQYGGNMIVSINGNVKNGLLHTKYKCGGRKKAEYGIDENNDLSLYEQAIINRDAMRKATNANNRPIPYLKDKHVKLTKAGKLTGAEFSTNMLDSIAKYSARAGLPLIQGIGLAAQESSLGNATSNGYRSQIERGVIYPSTLISNWSAGIDNPWNDLIATANRRAKGDKAKHDQYIKEGWNYAEKQAAKVDTSMNTLEHGFRKFKKGTYNTGDSNHTKDVINAGNAVWGSPEIQRWYRDQGKAFYERHRGKKACGGRTKAKYGSYDNMLGLGRATYLLNNNFIPKDINENNINEKTKKLPKNTELETITIDKTNKSNKPENIGTSYHDISFNAMNGLMRAIGRKINYNYSRHGNTDFRTADLDEAIFTNRPDTVKNITSIYGNDFVGIDKNSSSSRRAKEFKNANAIDIDNKIPISKISRYYGNDKNGKFKIGSLSDFDDNDYIAAVRNKSMPFNDVKIIDGKLVYFKDGKIIESSLPKNENNKHIVYNHTTGKKQFVSTTKDVTKLYNFYKQFLLDNDGYADIILLDNGRFEDNIYKGGRNLNDDEISDYYRNDFNRNNSFANVPVIIEGNMKKYGGRKKAQIGVSYFAPSLIGPKYDKVINITPDEITKRNLVYADATNPSKSFIDLLMNDEFKGYSSMSNFSNRRIGLNTNNYLETPLIQSTDSNISDKTIPVTSDKTSSATPTPTPTAAKVTPATPTPADKTSAKTPVGSKFIEPVDVRETLMLDEKKKPTTLTAKINYINPYGKQDNNFGLDEFNLYSNLGASALDFITSSILNSRLPGINLPTNLVAPTITTPEKIELKDNGESDIKAPAAVAAAKLKTRYNANPQLSKIEDETRRRMIDIDRNTSDSRVALARKQRATIESQNAKNQVYGQKENIETDLINKDKLNAQEIAKFNVGNYNNYLTAKAQQALQKAQLQMMVDKANVDNKLAVDRLNANAKLMTDQYNTENLVKELLFNNNVKTTKLGNYAQGISNLLGNIGGSIDNYTKNKAARKRDAEKLRAIQTMNKDVPVEILKYIFG